MVDDYYALLGVKRTDDTDTIKAAYRERKDAVTAMTGGTSKADAAALNKAWNVLSDPYQRGRYDASLEALPQIDVLDGDDIEVVEEPAPPRRRGLFSPPPPRDGKGPAKPTPTISAPPGTRFPEPRRRIVAMVIDLTVLLVFFIGSQFGAYFYNRENHQAELDAIEAIDDRLEKLNDNKDELEDRETDVWESNWPGFPNHPPQEQIGVFEKEIDTLEEERVDLNNELSPALAIATAAFFGFGLLYLIVPSALTGRTLGKKLQNVKAMRMDGRPLGWAGAVSRYGLLVLGTYLLSQFLGPLAAAIALFVVMGWMRSPNQQSILDRAAKTVVVTEANDG